MPPRSSGVLLPRLWRKSASTTANAFNVAIAKAAISVHTIGHAFSAMSAAPLIVSTIACAISALTYVCDVKGCTKQGHRFSAAALRRHRQTFHSSSRAPPSSRRPECVETFLQSAVDPVLVQLAALDHRRRPEPGQRAGPDYLGPGGHQHNPEPVLCCAFERESRTRISL